MKSSAEEIKIIEQVLNHLDDDSTDQQADLIQIPTTEYTSADRLEDEIAILFRRFPLIVGHVSSLPSPGDFLTHNDTGVPILVTRDKEGAIQAFLNVCRHRGARLEGRACGKANTFSCPYHGWTYDLTGRLRGLRKAEHFGDFDKGDYRLVKLPAFERFGLIWVRPSPIEPHESTDDPLDIDAWLAPMAEQLASLSLDSHVVYKTWTLERNMNWHIALEGFQEQYHFCTAHKHTACSAYLDTQGVYLDQYPHVRHAVPIASIGKLRDQPVDEWSYRRQFMTQNYLFPCNFLQVMTDHVYVHTITPIATDRCIFSCLMLIPETPTNPKAEQHWQANYDVVRRVFEEDFQIGEGIQAGLASGANDFFTIGRTENGIQLARKALIDALEGRLTAS